MARALSMREWVGGLILIIKPREFSLALGPI